MPAQAPPDAYTPVVVAPANANVAFAVPVEGPVLVAATAQMASAPPSILRRPPPPPTTQAAPQITRLSTSRANLGRFPVPPGSILSGVLRRGQKAYLEIELKVEPDGTLTSVEIRKSSEIYELDQKIVQHVKRSWKFNPQPMAGWYWWPFECEMP
jgi:TonB family protein